MYSRPKSILFNLQITQDQPQEPRLAGYLPILRLMVIIFVYHSIFTISRFYAGWKSKHEAR